MTRKKIVGILTALLLLSPMMSMADDPKLVDPVAAAVDAQDPVSDAGKLIDDATRGIDEQPIESAESIISAFKEGRWAAGIGLLVMFVIWGLRRFVWKMISTAALPYITLGLGCAVTVSIELVAGIPWWKALIDGFLSSASAMALWSLIFKHVMSPEVK